MNIVANGFTYSSGNFKVNVGDTVLLPYPWWHPDNNRSGCKGIEAVVTGTTSDYKGYIREIIDVVKRAPECKIKHTTTIAQKPRKLKEPVGLVTVKELEQRIREACDLTIDNKSFCYVKLGKKFGWAEVTS